MNKAIGWEERIKRDAAAYAAAGMSVPDPTAIEERRMSETLAEPAPNIKWLVPDYVPSRTVTLLTGDGGVGKSLLAMQLMTCVAAGRPFLGMTVERASVFGLFCEDENAILHHRQLRLSEALGVSDAELGEYVYVERGGEDAVMYGPMIEDPRSNDFTNFWFKIHDILRRVKPKLIVLDTVADIYGANENFRPDVRRFIRELRKMSYDYDAAVVLCAHPSLSGMSTGKGYSGSTAWHNSVRSRLYLTKPDDALHDDDRLISGKKNNYGPAQGDFLIRYVNGAFERVERGGTVARIERSARDRTILDLVRVAATAGKHLSKQPQAKERYLPNVASRQIPGMSFGLARKIMTDLLIDGELAEIMVDKHRERLGLIVPPVAGSLPPVNLQAPDSNG